MYLNTVTMNVNASGAEIAGDLAGQFIYGGRTANTHLTLYC